MVMVTERTRSGVDSKFGQGQAGFRRGRGTIEQIFILKNIIKQSIEWQCAFNAHRVDFGMTFDSVHRDRLWLIQAMVYDPR